MRLAALVVLLLALPASASAAPFGELPFQPVSSAATCLRPTGVPGELVRWVRGGVEVLDARPDGLVAVGTVPLGEPRGCPVVAGHPNGAAVLAAATEDGIRLALREPGGTWGAPMTLAGDDRYGPDVAISARGDAVVLWSEYRPASAVRVNAARRPAGGTFGAPERITGAGETASASVAMTGAGETFVVTVDRDVRITSAPLGTSLPPTRQLLAIRGIPSAAIAAAEDGRVLIAADDDGLVLFEREPGGDLVRRPKLPGSRGNVGVHVQAGGAAVVTWGGDTAVGAMLRSGPGAFGAPVELREERAKRPDLEPRNGSSFSFFGFGGDGPPYESGTEVRTALAADGRALLAWGVEDGGVRAAMIAASGLVERHAPATSVRDARGLTPLLLAGGARALAWTDHLPIFSAPPFRGRLHLAVEGAVSMPAPAPAIEAGAPRDRTLRPAQPLVLPVRCAAACDVRGAIDDDPTQDPGFSLSSAGTGTLRFTALANPIAPSRAGPVSVRLRWSAPGSGAVKTRTVRVRLRRLPAPRVPRILDLRARHIAGGKVEVRWRTDGPALDAWWSVLGSRVRKLEQVSDLVATGTAPTGDRRRYRVVLEDARAARHVTVTLSPLVGSRGREATVPVS